MHEILLIELVISKNNSISEMLVVGPYESRTKNTTLYNPFGNAGVGLALRDHEDGKSTSSSAITYS